MKKIFALVLAAVGILTLLITLPQLVETNNSGFYQVKQSALSGRMEVVTTPGTYWQLFGKITTYPISDVYYFSNSELDGQDDNSLPIKVTFNDGGKADISGSIKFRFSLVPSDAELVHVDFKSYESIKHDIIRQVVQESLNKTAAIMKAEESYSSRLAEFTSLAEDQVKIGVFETISEQITKKDSDNNELTNTIVRLVKDKNGVPVVNKPSPLLRYKIEVINFTIKHFDYDEKTQGIIAKKKEAEQAKVVSRANAEKAKQDAITAFENGKASVAIAEAAALVEMKTAVINAKRETAVAEQGKLKAQEEAAGRLARERAQAEANRLKVSAGLTPQERAEFAMKTKIGVAAELAKIKMPSTMVIGGDKSGGANPFDAIGLESYIRINERFSQQNDKE